MLCSPLAVTLTVWQKQIRRGATPLLLCKHREKERQWSLFPLSTWMKAHKCWRSLIQGQLHLHKVTHYIQCCKKQIYIYIWQKKQSLYSKPEREHLVHRYRLYSSTHPELSHRRFLVIPDSSKRSSSKKWFGVCAKKWAWKFKMLL